MLKFFSHHVDFDESPSLAQKLFEAFAPAENPYGRNSFSVPSSFVTGFSLINQRLAAKK